MNRQIISFVVLMIAAQLSALRAATVTFSIDDIVVVSGVEYTVEVKASAAEPIVNFQFDLTLPANLSMVPEDGAPKLGTMTGDYQLAYCRRSNGSYRIIGYSLNNTAITGDGVLLTFKVKALETGKSTLTLSKVITASTRNFRVGFYLPSTDSQVSAHTAGDVNGDFDVNEVDAQMVLDVAVDIIDPLSLAVPMAINVPGGNNAALEVNAQLILNYSVATAKPW